MAELLDFCLNIAAEHKGKPCPKCGGHGTVVSAYQVGDTLIVPPGMLNSLNSSEPGQSPLLSLRVVEDPNILPATCDDCHGSGMAPPEVCEVEDLVPEQEYLHAHDRTARRYHTIYYSPIVRIAADWLEEGGDPRAEVLRGMRLVRHADDRTATPWEVHPYRERPPGSRGEVGRNVFPTQADAIRELLRRALGVATVECPCQKAIDPRQPWNPSLICKCSGRGWLPARVEDCKACSEGKVFACPNDPRHNVTHGVCATCKEMPSGAAKHGQMIACTACHGRKWVKVPIS